MPLPQLTTKTTPTPTPNCFAPRSGGVLPNGGYFTGYEGHVPSLLAGNASEWGRMVGLLLREGEKAVADPTKGGERTAKGHLFSDMHALAALRGSKTASYYKWKQHLVMDAGGLIKAQDERKPIQCAAIRGVVLHYSHAALGKSGKNHKERAAVMGASLSALKEECGGGGG